MLTLKQKCKLAINLFDVDSNKNLGYEELMIMFSVMFNSLQILSSNPARMTFSNMLQDRGILGQGKQLRTSKGIEPEDLYAFILQNTELIKFLGKYQLFE